MCILGFLLALVPLSLLAQEMAFKWLNQPCAQVLNCDKGYTACNLPEVSGAALIGTNMAVLGVDVCPHPITTGDNALHTYGWPASPDELHALLFSGLTLQPLHLDSVIIRHHRSDDGPALLAMDLSINNGPSVPVGDFVVTDAFATTVYTNLVVVAAESGMAMSLFQLKVRPHQGNGGSWVLDEVRIVSSPAAPTSMEELSRTSTVTAQLYDLLGRLAPHLDANGLFIDCYKRIRVQ